MKTSHAIPEGLAGNVLGESGCRHTGHFRWALVTGALALALLTPGAGFAKEPEPAPAQPLQSADYKTPRLETPSTVLSWETRVGRSYVLPALDIVGFEVLLNRFDFYVVDKEVYGTTFNSISDNFTGKWIVDTDPFAMNQFMHPISGSLYYGFARSAGLNYWESFGYSILGSYLWEIAGETGLPSINDLFTTGVAGPFLGEPLFRMASLLLEGTDGTPGFWRELGAAVISPGTGFNRLVYGNRFHTVYKSRNPATFSRLQLGASQASTVHSGGLPDTVKRKEAIADFSLAYGLPGKPDYRYTHPFDYFHFQFTASSANTFENLMTRGILIGKDYAVGDSYRGLWGLYGSYDYISPQVFRVSSTAFSLGTTAQWWLSQSVALQGSLLGGAGYGAAGTLKGTGERDYHYGATPQWLLALRLLFGDVASLDTTVREFYVTGIASTENRGSEHIFRGDAAFTVRVHGPHAIMVKYVESHRDAHYPDIADRHQTVGTVSFAYTLLSDTKFGAVEWRTPDSGGR